MLCQKFKNHFVEPKRHVLTYLLAKCTTILCVGVALKWSIIMFGTWFHHFDCFLALHKTGESYYYLTMSCLLVVFGSRLLIFAHGCFLLLVLFLWHHYDPPLLNECTLPIFKSSPSPPHETHMLYSLSLVYATWSPWAIL